MLCRRVRFLAARHSLRAAILLLCGGSALVAGKATHDVPATAFAGLWRAEYAGKPFVVLRFRAGEALAGTGAAGQVNIDEEGAVQEVTREARTEVPLRSPQWVKGAIRFQLQEGSDAAQYEMRLTGQDTAELRTLDAPGVPVFLLTRTDAGSRGQALFAGAKARNFWRRSWPGRKRAPEESTASVQ